MQKAKIKEKLVFSHAFYTGPSRENSANNNYTDLFLNLQFFLCSIPGPQENSKSYESYIFLPSSTPLSAT